MRSGWHIHDIERRAVNGGGLRATRLAMLRGADNSTANDNRRPYDVRREACRHDIRHVGKSGRWREWAIAASCVSVSAPW